MSDEALTPLIHHHEFDQVKGMDYDPDTVGFNSGEGTWYWHLHHPEEGPTLALWGGEGSDVGQTPVPEPQPKGKFFMPADDWNNVKDGRLLENRNRVIV